MTGRQSYRGALKLVQNLAVSGQGYPVHQVSVPYTNNPLHLLHPPQVHHAIHYKLIRPLVPLYPHK